VKRTERFESEWGTSLANLRMWLSGRAPAFQAEYAGSTPVIRSLRR
jgi:hypothetical protein